MSWQTDMLTVMAKNKVSSGGLKLGVMTGANSCKVGQLALTKDDLMFSAHLLHQICTKVSVSGTAHTDNSSYLPALKAGDSVLVYQLSETKCLILERMVSV